MFQNSYTDLKIVLILTFLSVIFLFIPSLNQYPQNMVSYAFLLIFLPGYALLAAIKPSVYGISVSRRIIFGALLGAILAAATYLLGTYTPLTTYLAPFGEYLNPLQVYVSPLEAYLPLVFILATILTVDLALIAWARRKSFNPETEEERERYLYCEKCNGYYKLGEDESPEAFGSCQCGGNLVYTEKGAKKGKTDNGQVAPTKFYGLDILFVLLLSLLSLVVLLELPQYQTLAELLLILFLPGYALVSMIYPGRGDIGGLERAAYGVASSIALTTLVGIILNYTPYKSMEPIVYVLTGLTISLLLVAYMRRHNLPGENRFSLDYGGFFNGLRKGFSKESKTEKIITLMLITSFALVAFTTYATTDLAGVAYTTNPMGDGPYTDFHVLGADGNMVSSLNLISGGEYNLTVSIVNHENRNTTYRVLVTAGGNVQTDETITLENGQRGNINFNFTVGEPGTRDMEFNLYKLPDNNNIYKSLKIPLIVNEVPAN